jgi:MFS family permease
LRTAGKLPNPIIILTHYREKEKDGCSTDRSRGLPNTFGVFQTYYIGTLMPECDASRIAWIGSIQLFFTTIGCLPAGILIDHGYLKSLIAVGTFLEILGLVLTSFFHGYWAIFFSQGVCMGIGSGLMAVIPVAVLSMFFEKKRMLATGLASTGASVAGIAYTMGMRCLFTSIGFAWAVRVFALIVLVTNIVAFFIMRLQSQYGGKDSGFGFHHFKDLPYTVFVVAFTLFVASSFAPFFFIQDYAIRLGVSKDMAFNLLSIMNAANIFGRFVPNFIADRYGGVNTLLPLSVACIITFCMLPLATGINGLIAISIVYGFLSGGVIIIPGPTITDLSHTKSEIGARLGLAYLIAAFGGLLGNPAMGALKGEGRDAVENFQAVWFCAAGIMGAGVIALVATRWLKLGSAWASGRV